MKYRITYYIRPVLDESNYLTAVVEPGVLQYMRKSSIYCIRSVERGD